MEWRNSSLPRSLPPLGIVTALISAGQGFSITALMGILMVVGIAVSNGILLVDDANGQFTEGAEKLVLVPVMFTFLARRSTVVLADPRAPLPAALGEAHA